MGRGEEGREEREGEEGGRRRGAVSKILITTGALVCASDSLPNLKELLVLDAAV